MYAVKQAAAVDTCEYLARIGYESLFTPGGRDRPELMPTAPDDPDSALDCAEATRHDHLRLAGVLRGAEPAEPLTGSQGARWLGLRLSWPDRLPDLVTWAGRQTLAKLIRSRQKALTHDEIDLFEYRVPNKGTSGFDRGAAADPIDVGFSPAALGMAVVQWPAVELLAVVGLNAVPLVSFGCRDVGFLHGGRLWRFRVEGRAGGYYHRWGAALAVSVEEYQ